MMLQDGGVKIWRPRQVLNNSVHYSVRSSLIRDRWVDLRRSR